MIRQRPSNLSIPRVYPQKKIEIFNVWTYPNKHEQTCTWTWTTSRKSLYLVISALFQFDLWLRPFPTLGQHFYGNTLQTWDYVQNTTWSHHHISAASDPCLRTTERVHFISKSTVSESPYFSSIRATASRTSLSLRRIKLLHPFRSTNSLHPVRFTDIGPDEWLCFTVHCLTWTSLISSGFPDSGSGPSAACHWEFGSEHDSWYVRWASFPHCSDQSILADIFIIYKYPPGFRIRQQLRSHSKYSSNKCPENLYFKGNVNGITDGINHNHFHHHFLSKCKWKKSQNLQMIISQWFAGKFLPKSSWRSVSTLWSSLSPKGSMLYLVTCWISNSLTMIFSMTSFRNWPSAHPISATIIGSSTEYVRLLLDNCFLIAELIHSSINWWPAEVNMWWQCAVSDGDLCSVITWVYYWYIPSILAVSR